MLVYLTYVFTVFGHVGPFKNVLENYLPNKEIKKALVVFSNMKMDDKNNKLL